MLKPLLVCAIFCLSLYAAPGHAQGGISFLDDEAEAGGFDFTAKLLALPCEVWLARQENGDGYKITVASNAVALHIQKAGKSTVLAASPQSVAAGAQFIAQRRGPRWNIYLGPKLAVMAEDDSFAEGTIGYRGRLAEARVQPVEPIRFKDDFMRVASEVAMQAAAVNPRRGVKIKEARFTEDIWRVVRGKWQTTGLTENSEAQVAQSANPFAFRSSGIGQAVALTGRNFWSDYAAAVSVLPDGANALGLLVYAQDADNYLGMVWTRSAGPQLRSVVAGKVSVLDAATALQGYEDKQWYRLRVTAVGGFIRGFIDDEEVLRARSSFFGRGAVGVYAESAKENNNVTYDDAEVLSEETFVEDFAVAVPGRWKNISGKWAWNKSAQPVGDAGAYAVMGQPSWADYSTSAQLRVPSDASVGLLAHHLPGKGAYLLRVTGSASKLPHAGKVQLVKIAGTRPLVLAETSVGTRYNGTNLRWSLTSERGYLRASADGKRIVDAFDTSLSEGRPGVYAQKGPLNTPSITNLLVEFPNRSSRWAIVPDLYELEQQAQTMGGWSTPEGLWVPASASQDQKVLLHKGAFWGDDTLRLPVPELKGGKSAQLLFKPSAGRQITLTLSVTDKLNVNLTDGTKSWNGTYGASGELEGTPLEVSRRGSYLIVRAGKKENQKVVLAAPIG